MRKTWLYLSLKRVWFRLIKSGVKKCEYREITPYWIQRLLCVVGDKPVLKRVDKIYANELAKDIEWLKRQLSTGKLKFKPFTDVMFTDGYPKKEDVDRHYGTRVNYIDIGKVNPEWAPLDVPKDREFFRIWIR